MPMTTTYDFVVIGAGPAGCVVAAGLADAGVGSIAEIKAGPSEAHPFVKIPFALISLKSSRHHWHFTSANTYAPAMMIGRRAGQMTAKEAA